jgi:hypothetical protein
MKAGIVKLDEHTEVFFHDIPYLMCGRSIIVCK